MVRFRLSVSVFAWGCAALLLGGGASSAATRILDLALDPVPASGECPTKDDITIDGLEAESFFAEILRTDKVRWRVKNKYRKGDWVVSWKNGNGEWDHFKSSAPHEIRRGASGNAHHEAGPPAHESAPLDHQWHWSYSVSVVWPKSQTDDCAKITVDPKIIISNSSNSTTLSATDLLAAAAAVGVLSLTVGFAAGMWRERRGRRGARPAVKE